MDRNKHVFIRLLLSLVLMVAAVIVTGDLKLRFAVLRPWDTALLVAWMYPLFFIVIPGSQWRRLTLIPFYAASIAAAGVYDWLRHQPVPLVQPATFGLIATVVIIAGMLFIDQRQRKR